MGSGAFVKGTGRGRGAGTLALHHLPPRDMDQDLIDVFADVPQVMPYFHLPVQAGSDKILKAMNRHHTADDYRRIVERLRKARPDIALSGISSSAFLGKAMQILPRLSNSSPMWAMLTPIHLNIHPVLAPCGG